MKSKFADFKEEMQINKPFFTFMKPHDGTGKIKQKTINDFGEQWACFQDNNGFYGSQDLFKDIMGSLLNVREIKDRRIADIGSGTGRIVSMILDNGAKHVVAVEPSDAFDVLVKNTQAHKDKITYLNVTGDKIPPYGDLDFIFSIGVLHHIPDPQPVVKAALSALKPGGKFVVWVYGKGGEWIIPGTGTAIEIYYKTPAAFFPKCPNLFIGLSSMPVYNALQTLVFFTSG